MRAVRTVYLVVTAVAVVAGAWASEVAWQPNPLTFAPGETGVKAVAIYFKSFSAPTTIRSVGFRIKSTGFSSGKLKLQTEGGDPKVTWELPMTLTAASSTPDGMKMVGRFSTPLSGTVADQKIATIYIERGTAADGETFTVTFDVANTTDNAINLTDDSRYEPDTWRTLTVRMIKEANPPRDVSAAATSPQKDPVRVTLTWTDRSADDFQMQWKRPSETTWKNVTTGMVEDIANKRIDWTTQGITGFSKYETVQIRVRVLDQGKVWDGTAVVDGAANPEKGWAQVPNNVVVDNQPPAITSASGANGSNKVAVVFNEAVAAGAAQPANYSVQQVGGSNIPVTGATSLNQTTVQLTLQSALVAGNTYTVRATNIADLLGNVAASLTKNISLEANPPRDLAWAANGLPAATRDPVVGRLTWGAQYSATAIEVQYSENRTSWTNASAVTPDIANKSFSWDTPFTEKTIYVRARVLDQGKVWNGTAVVDAASNPDAGWQEWPNAVRVDNVRPQLVQASGTSGSNKVEVTYNEDMADNATTAANYTVRRTDNQQVIGVTAAAFQTGSRRVVILTLASALSDNVQYKLTANQVTDRVGNPLANNETDILFKPKLIAASLKHDGVNKTIVAEFNMAMKDIGTAGQWRLTGAGGASVQISAVALDQNDRRKVNVTTAAELAQDTGYELTCPTTATSVNDKQVGNDNKVSFRTPFWHAFAVEATKVYSVGVPLNTDGARVRGLLAAAAVAEYNTAQPAWVIDNGGATQVGHVVGKGYFAKWGVTRTVTAYIAGTRLSPPQQLSVPAGWNLISNPFFTNLPLSQLKLGTKGFRYAWWWDGSSYKLVANVTYPPLGAETELRPWVGYWVWCAAAGNIQLGATTSAAEAAEPLAIGADGDVLVPLVARAGDAEDTVTVCGVGQVAEAVANPPFVPGSVDLAFVGGAEPLAIDVRTGSPAQKWE
ncbi:MAG: Ig-like domain-containing protein, partial [Armatimonadetes bacterium]|nr:Ig-like domain-containing protein [Armatimonadota bacterium]